MPTIHMTRVGAFGAAPSWLAAKGCNVNRYLADFGIAAEKMVNLDDLIPLELTGELGEEVEGLHESDLVHAGEVKLKKQIHNK